MDNRVNLSEIQYDNIPDELKELNIWFVWGWAEREGKRTKPPLDVNRECRFYGRTSGPGHERTLTSFYHARDFLDRHSGDVIEVSAAWDKAKEAYTRTDRVQIAGLGFKLIGDYVGIDLDHCINGKVSDEARSIIDTLGSYTEVSPSGTGVRILCKGSIPKGGNKRGGVEVYDFTSPRFLTMTGNVLESRSKAIEWRQDELRQFHRQFFGEVAAPSPDRPTVRQTHDLDELPTDIRDAFHERLDALEDVDKGNRSEACFGFLCWCVRVGLDPDDVWERVQDVSKFGERNEAWFLHQWSAAESRIESDPDPDPEAGMRGEELPDWFASGDFAGDAHEAEAEGAGWKDDPDLEESIKQQQAQNEAKNWTFPVLEYDEILTLKPPKFLIRKTLPADGIAMLYGPTRSFKSFLALEWSLCLATGLPWHGIDVRRTKVLYLYSEAPTTLKPRVEAWRRTRHVPADDLRGWFRAITVPMNIDDEDHHAALLRTIRKSAQGVGMIVVDTLDRNMTGVESDQKDTKRIVAAIVSLQKSLQNLILLVHHTGKDITRGPKGDNRLLNCIDASYSVLRSPTSDVICLECVKQKGIEEEPPRYFRGDVIDLNETDDYGDEVTSLVLTPASKEDFDRKEGDVTPGDRELIDATPILSETSDEYVKTHGLAIGVLAERLGRDKGNVSRAIARLEPKYLCVRRIGRMKYVFRVPVTAE